MTFPGGSSDAAPAAQGKMSPSTGNSGSLTLTNDIVQNGTSMGLVGGGAALAFAGRYGLLRDPAAGEV